MSDSFILSYYNSKSNFVKALNKEFIKPIFENKLYNNKLGLVYNSDYIVFNKNQWHQNPQNFCLDYYGIYELYKVILLVNNIPSIFFFISDNFIDNNIIVPKLKTIEKCLI